MNALPTRIIPHGKQKARGFTLIELLMSILLMGLSISGLFGFLFWGQMNYAEVGSNWRRGEILCQARQTIRQVITSSKNVALADLRAFLQKKLVSSGRVKLEQFSLEPYPPAKERAVSPGAVFVKAVFFDDTNRNGRRDQSEPAIDRLWCYRGRTP